MIQTFRHRGLKRLYERGDRSKVPSTLRDRIEDAMALLDVASSPQDLDLPGFRLHPLKGTLKGFHSITLSGNWRLVFRLVDGHANDVDLLDYH
ncbi:MAG: type II toxin-antitoxin system RelE/ParE family toxin [Rhodospirillaceae bacterium]